MGSGKFKLEARSSVDCGWYDCSVQRRGSRLLVQFDGYEAEEEEELESLEHLRFSSLPAEDHHCKLLLPGTHVTGFKRSKSCEIWVDAAVSERIPGGHSPRSPCNCSFSVTWLDSEKKGQTDGGLGLQDICLLDSRPLSAHPDFATFRQARRGGGGQPQQEAQVPDTPPNGSPSPSGASPAAAVASRQQPPLRPPSSANGPPCSLCGLATLRTSDSDDISEDMEVPAGSAASDFAGVQLDDLGWIHRRCAAWSFLPALRALGLDTTKHFKRMDPSLRTALREAMFSKCCQCGLAGATAKCSAANCRTAFHMHCTAAAKVDWEKHKLLCPGHAVLGGVKAVAGSQFYETQPHKRGSQQRRGGSNLTLQRMLQGSRKRQLDLQPTLGGKKAKAGGAAGRGKGQGRGGLRRSGRQNNRVNYAGDDAEDEPEGSEYDGDEFEDDEHARLLYQDESGEDLEDEDLEQSGGRGRSLRRGQGREKAGVRKSERSRRQVKTYDESRAERELWEEANREAARAQTNGYEDTHCQVCHSKARSKEMLLCDGCDLGWHMGCLTPPLHAQPLANWFCPDCLQHQECEACGKAASPTTKRKKKRGASPSSSPLDFCTGCGAVCHPGCMQGGADGGGGGLCKYCVDGLTAAEAILGCRQARGRREYYLKFKEVSYRRCAWVLESTALRMCPDRVARFQRDTRGAANVEPNVQPQWLQVERVIAVRTLPPSPGGAQQCLVKWRGLSYGAATWEAREQVEKEAIQQYERRMALRVERKEGQEAAVRKGRPPQLPSGGPPFLQGVGTLKSYQESGITWLLSKLHANMSAILGDEMGLGKTIQTAVFLQVAREKKLATGPMLVVVPLSTIGSWERELAKWAPGLEVLAYNGDQESRAGIRKYELGSEEDGMEAARQKTTALIPRFHVMLTTYEVADKDASVLRRFAWSGMVIDEGHRLKGENSKLGAQLRSFGSPWRLLLTGTPLQNNLRELFALLAFMADCTIEDVERRIKALPDPNPPPPATSRRSSPLKKAPAEIDSSNPLPAAPIDPETLEAQAYVRRLHSYLEPRMLRRLKHNTLLGELPAKITRRVACRLSPLQRQLYADLLARNYDALNSMARNRCGRKSMSNLLMRLRQACNHPYIFPGQEPEDLTPEEAQRLLVASCGKLSVLQQMLPRLLHGGHRVLIFSQSTELLNILEDFLHGFQDTTGLLPKPETADVAAASSDDDNSSDGDAEGTSGGGKSDDEEGGRGGAVIPFYRIDGSTKLQERQAMIDSFNSPNCKVQVFLMSTRAGSLGINLQTADTVILYDPDFNPFVDAQAEGRAHRLGQQKTVIVYQMFTAHTVEERILDLAAKKRRLEEVVTKHLGREKEVSNEDLKSSLFYGWGNLMRSSEDGRGDDVSLRESDVAALLDRSRVQEGDLVIGADAASLLGEVVEGGAAAMSFERQAEQDEQAEQAVADSVMDRVAEERMMRLLAERAQRFNQEKLEAEEQMTRGRRVARRTRNYNEASDSDDCFESDASPGTKERWRQSDKASKWSRDKSDNDADYNPLRSPFTSARLLQIAAGKRGCQENDQPNRPMEQGGMCPSSLFNLPQPPSSSSSSDNDYSDDSSSSDDSTDKRLGRSGSQQALLERAAEILRKKVQEAKEADEELSRRIARQGQPSNNASGAR